MTKQAIYCLDEHSPECRHAKLTANSIKAAMRAGETKERARVIDVLIKAGHYELVEKICGGVK